MSFARCFILVLTLFFSAQPFSRAADREPVRIGDIVFDALDASLVTFFGRSNNTAYIVTRTASGDYETLRISGRGKIKQIVEYDDWIYGLSPDGKLYAVDTSLGTRLRNKIPVVLKRLVTKIPHAAGTVLAVSLFALVDISAVHSASAAGIDYSPWTIGLYGGAIFYLADASMTFFLRSYRQLDIGGDFFRKELVRGVEKMVYDPVISDWRIYQRTADNPLGVELFLSDIAPKHRRGMSCVYYFTRMNLE
jgi:hypothetical protein